MIRFLSLLAFCHLSASAIPWDSYSSQRDSGTIFKIPENGTVHFSCNAGGSGEIVRWSKNRKLIADSRKEYMDIVPPNIKLFDNNTLEISQSTSTDSGEYTCQIIRPGLEVVNIHYTLEVQYPATVSIIPKDGQVKVKINSNVQLTCKTSGVPKPSISWTFKAQEIKLLTQRETLSFNATSPEMGGEYQCIAMNTANAESAVGTFYVEIEYVPVVRTEKLWIHTSPGGKLDIECQITGNPTPEIRWLFNGTQISFNTRLSHQKIGDKSKIRLERVSEKNFGFFTCRGTNSLGESQQVIQVSGAPSVAVFKKASYDPLEQGFNLIWQIYSETPLIAYKLRFRNYTEKAQKYEWTDRHIAPKISTSTFHEGHFFLPSSPPAVYEAQVLSRNRHGWSKPSMVVRLSSAGEGSSTTDSLTEPVQETSIVTDGYSTSIYESSPVSSSSSTSFSVAVLLTSALFCKIM